MAGVVAEKIRQSPSLEDVRSQFPNAPVTIEADGSWRVSVTDRADMKRASAMLSGVREADRGLGHIMRQNETRERVRMADGRAVEVTSESVDIAKGHASFRPVISWGRPHVTIRYRPDGTREEWKKNPDGSWEMV